MARRPTALLLALDAGMLDLVERGYLWLYDRTGAPKGAVFVLAWSVPWLRFYAEGWIPPPALAVVLLVGGVVGLFEVFLQTALPVRTANLVVEMLRASRRRALFDAVMTLALGLGGVLAAASGELPVVPLSWAFALYVNLARLRDRIPPRLEPEIAPEAAGT